MSKNREIVISTKNVNKTYFIRENKSYTIKDIIFNSLKKRGERKIIYALKNINLNIYKGEIFGIIGRNGSGKSTLLNIIMGSIIPNKGGQVHTDGKIIRLSLGMGVDRNLSARDNIYVNGSILGLTFKKIGSIFDDLIQFAGLEDFVDTPVKFYSKGMHQRLVFSIAMHAEADIILLDEFFGGTGDKDFKSKSEKAFKERIVEGKTIILVSHTMKTIEEFCDRVLWLEKGIPRALGNPPNIIQEYEQYIEKKR